MFLKKTKMNNKDDKVKKSQVIDKWLRKQGDRQMTRQTAKVYNPVEFGQSKISSGILLLKGVTGQINEGVK